MHSSKVIIPIFGVFDVTGEVITMWIIMAILAVISLIVRFNLKERPGRFQNMVETGIEYLENFFAGILGTKKTEKYFTFLGSLFIFIIFSNYSGLIPGVAQAEWLAAPTASLSVTAGLGVVTFVAIQTIGLRAGGRKYLTHFLKPVFVILPLLILDEFIKPMSLALRLYGNIFGEESVTEQLYGILPIGPPIIMMALSLMFCAIQAVVFTMLTSIYIEEATDLE